MTEKGVIRDNIIPVKRTESEIDAYIDGYRACFNTYTHYLLDTSDIGESISIMRTIVKTLKDIFRKEGG